MEYLLGRIGQPDDVGRTALSPAPDAPFWGAGVTPGLTGGQVIV